MQYNKTVWKPPFEVGNRLPHTEFLMGLSASTGRDSIETGADIDSSGSISIVTYRFRGNTE